MTQTDRILAALTRAGARGITRVDFQLPDVCDGGTPILNLPGRIYDLRAAGIEIAEVGRRNACVVYALDRSVEAPARRMSDDGERSEEGTGRASRRGAEPHEAVASAPPEPEEEPLFDMPAHKPTPQSPYLTRDAA